MSLERFNPFSGNKSEADRKKARRNTALAVAAGLGIATAANEGIKNYKQTEVAEAFDSKSPKYLTSEELSMSITPEDRQRAIAANAEAAKTQEDPSVHWYKGGDKL